MQHYVTAKKCGKLLHDAKQKIYHLKVALTAIYGSYRKWIASAEGDSETMLVFRPEMWPPPAISSGPKETLLKAEVFLRVKKCLLLWKEQNSQKDKSKFH